MALRVSEPELTAFAAWVKDRSGIFLDAGKAYLLEGRLGALAERAGCDTVTQLQARAREDPGLASRIIEALSTNETSFFRDRKVFDLIKNKLVPDLLGADPRKPLAIWSAASSTGQEAYSVAMALEQILFDLAKVNVRVRGTDISEAVVNVANKAEYGAADVARGLEPKELTKYFTRVGDKHRIRDDLRLVCRFEVDNLIAPRMHGPFDLILCRNVLIYFDVPDRKRVVENLLRQLKPGGALLFGATDSVLDLSPRLKRAEYHGVAYYLAP